MSTVRWFDGVECAKCGSPLLFREDKSGGNTTIIPAHSLASSSFDVNGTLGEQFDFPWWS